ncbi:glucosidase, partial [candidate division KSB1 bacterium]|nr:glucosidase [candidate division KSB1 bacterium]
MNAEKKRLAEARSQKAAWKKWGPYVTERQWGTVREDYSPYGNAWEFVSHDAARSKAFRWGEEGLAGICDERQLLLCFALALWNGRDPILKERLFGLTGNEGNHGEDVKEYYYYLDSTPTHSYMKMLYKYPHAEFPYGWLVEENRRRGKGAPEFELIDTGIFNDDRYFDVFIEYAKAAPDDILIRITAHNRGPEAATLHLLPTVWLRNTWAWGVNGHKPSMGVTARGGIEINQTDLGKRWLLCEGDPRFLFCENETNVKRLYNVEGRGYFKDGINEYVVHGNLAAVNPAQIGTKAAAHYRREIPAGKSATLRLRLSNVAIMADQAFADFDQTFAQRQKEADEFYAEIQAPIKEADAKDVQRQAFAGILMQLTKSYQADDKLELAIEQARRWLALDPLDD